MLHNLQSLPGILRVNQYGSNETFPEDVKELLMLDSDAKSCDEDESRQYQEMDKIEHDFEESDDYDTEDNKDKDSDNDDDVFQD